MILGLDVSTSSTGATFLSDSGERLLTTHFDLKKEKGIYRKMDKLKIELLDIICEMEESHGPLTGIYIEEPFKVFGQGKSSANVISMLQGFNATISYLLYHVFQIEPVHVNAMTARSLNDIKVPRGQKAKTVVIEHLLKNEPDFKVSYTKKGNIQTYWYDRADSIIIARAGLALSKKTQ